MHNRPNNGEQMTPTLIVTRPAQQGEEFARAVRERYADQVRIILSPLIEISTLPVTDDFSDLEGVIFTSAHAVGAVNLPAGITAWCVGPRTAECAKDAGFDVVVGTGDASGLVEFIVDRAPCGRLAHIRGQHARGNVAGTLQAHGLQCDDVVAYEQRALALTAEAKLALKGEFPVVLPLFSPRTATILSEQRQFVAPLHLVVMSDVVKKAAGTVGAQTITVAAQPNGQAMVEATLTRLDALINNAS